MTALAAFTFLRPLALLALPVLAALWLLLRRRARAEAAPTAPIAPHLLAALAIGGEGRRRIDGPDLALPAAMLLAIGVAGPAWRPAPAPFVAETAPLVIALDLSPTMTARDLAPSRLERGKQKIRDLLALRAGGRAALVAYSGTAHVVMPLTEDPSVLLPFLEGLDPAIMPDHGRAASKALALGETLLAGEDAAGSILFVTDGIDPGDIAAFPSGGSARAALIVAPDPGAEIADWSRRADVAAVTATLDGGDLAALQRALATRLARAAAAAGRLQDEGWMLAIPAALLLLLWIRRGALLACALALGLAPVAPAQAEGPGDTLAGWFLTPDQQGRRLYEAHRYREAAAAFADPEWRAMALIRAGDYQQAADLLAPIQSPRAQYDRGVALVRGRDYAGGKAAFEAALALEPREAGVAADAKANLEVTNRIIAYLTEMRQAEDQDQGAEPPDATTDDLTGDKGATTRITAGAGLSEEAADQWMRQVETRPADFLKSRFAVEARR